MLALHACLDRLTALLEVDPLPGDRKAHDRETRSAAEECRARRTDLEGVGSRAVPLWGEE